jgi:hypothetical protein
VRGVSREREKAYCRVYHGIIDDPKFADVYDNDAALATWLRLLIIADQAWPSSAVLPGNAKHRAVKLLGDVGLLDLQPGWRFRVHGLDAERDRRASAARVGGLASGRSRTVERSFPTRSHDARDETNLAKPSLAENEPSRAGDPADDYYVMTGKYPNDKVLGWIDGLTGEYGADAVTRALATCHQQDRSTTTLLGRAQDVLRRDARGLDRAEKVAELARIEANRPPKGVNVQVLISRHNHGQHADDPDANCPSCRRAA